MHVPATILLFFFFNDPATTEIYTLPLHDALPIWLRMEERRPHGANCFRRGAGSGYRRAPPLVPRFLTPRVSGRPGSRARHEDRKSTRLNSSHGYISYAVFCLKKKNEISMSPLCHH